MFNVKCFLLLMVIVALPMASVWADDSVPLVAINANQIDTCLPVPNTLKPIRIAKVLHKGNEAVGSVRVGDATESIYSQTDLKDIVRVSLERTLARCGYKVVRDTQAIALTLTIDEFFSGTRNKFLVGKGETKASFDVELVTADGNSRYTFRFANSADLKGFAGGKVKRLAKSLNGILLDVMQQVAASPAFLNGMQDFSQL
jgi:uncharacterized lipoprotein YajG